MFDKDYAFGVFEVADRSMLLLMPIQTHSHAPKHALDLAPKEQVSRTGFGDVMYEG